MDKKQLFEKLQLIYTGVQDKKVSEFTDEENELMSDSIRYELVSDVIDEMSNLSKYRIYYDLQQELEVD